VEHGVVAEVDEVPGFGVAPVDRANPRADVGLHAAVPDRQKPHRRGDRHHAQLQPLLDLRVGRDVDGGAVDARHRPLVEADAHAGLEIVAQPDEPFAAHHRAVEVFELERERFAIDEQHVAVDSRILAAREESADIDSHGLSVLVVRVHPRDLRISQHRCGHHHRGGHTQRASHTQPHLLHPETLRFGTAAHVAGGRPPADG
jgi:hypothetical protein